MTCRTEEGGSPRCGLAETAKTVEVRGHSALAVRERRESPPSSDYDVMIVGEAPGQEEDRWGLPFQGRAGAKLFDFISKAGLDPSRVFITNIVRCRPPGNRRPSVKEISICRPYLEEEIRHIMPKVVILLGNSALRLFNLHNEGGITYIRGKVYRKRFPGWDDDTPEFNIIPTIHPAAFLHNPNPKSEARVVEDYRTALHLLEGKTPKEIYHSSYRLADNFGEVMKLAGFLTEAGRFAFDTESVSLPFTKFPLMCLSFCWGHEQVAILPIYRHKEGNSPYQLEPVWSETERRQVVGCLRMIFEDPEIEKIAHNLKYDMNVLKWHLGIDVKGKLWDTIAMHHILDEKRPHDLESLANIEFGVGDYSWEIRKIVGQSRDKTYDAIPDEVLWPYSATDAEATFRLWEVYHKEMSETPKFLRLYDEESEPLLKALAKAERTGSLLRTEIVEDLKQEAQIEITELETKMKKATWPEFNAGSPAEVYKAGCQLGYSKELTDKSKTMGFSTGKGILTELGEKEEFFKWVLQFRSNKKLLGTYLENVLNDIDSDGRCRYSWLLHGTETGRLSCRFLHQVPRIDRKRVEEGRPVMRDLIVAPPGYRLVYADFSQVELRIMAIVSADKEMLRLLNTAGADIHNATTAEVLGIPEDGTPGEIKVGKKTYQATVGKPNRDDIGKRVNFGLAYGSQGFSLVATAQWTDVEGEKHNITWDMLEEGMQRWHARFPGVSRYLTNTPDEARNRGGVIENCFGRERRFGTRLVDEKQFIRERAERECVNFPVQSAAGGLTNRTIIKLDQMLDEHIETGGLDPLGVRLINTVHDSIMYEVMDDYVDWFVEAVRIVGTRPIPELGGASFPLNIGVGGSWTEAELNAS